MMNTFASKATRMIVTFVDHHEDREFVHIGQSLIESEELIDRLYEVYLNLIAKGWHGSQNGLALEDIGEAYLNGFYVPCVPRVVFTGQVDLRNDPLPKVAGLVDWERGRLGFLSVRKARLPRNWALPCKAEPYAVSCMERDEYVERSTRRSLGTSDLLTGHSYFVGVRPDGHIIPAVSVGFGQEVVGKVTVCTAMFAGFAALVINANADARYLWCVETAEETIGSRFRTPLRLGVSPEHVKSLFYARSLPVTESGRKRPILHWVRAHQRRVREGIEVDVARHLRGITSFEMGGFDFTITQPCR